jgi:hypothetical protein
MPAIVNITWNFVPGSLSTLVEYKLSSSSTWITPTSPSNPTTQNTYTLIVNENTFYDVRLTTNGIRCAPKSVTFQIFAPQGACCPPGFTLSDDETYCFQINTTAATPPSNPTNTEAISNNWYSVYGSLIYDVGFDVQGFGPYTQIPYTNGFWVNGPGYPNSSFNTTDGPLNRTGLWSVGGGYPGQIVGFTVCVTVPSNTIYYVGIGADNSGRITIDGNVIVDQDYTAMGNYLSTHGYPAAFTDVPFRFWNIYPVTLTAGSHVMEIVGINEPITPFPNPGAVGIEIYNATSAEIQAATSYVDLGAKLIFSSKDYVGQPIQVGSEGFGYSCPSGYSLVLCDGPAYCTQTLIVSPIACTTTTTTTTTTSTTSSTTTTTTTP